MESLLLVSLVLGQLLVPVLGEHMSNKRALMELNECEKWSPNGCCPKGYLRNALGLCVEEKCTSNWHGLLSRQLTMSCYVHWFLLGCTALIAVLMLALLICNVVFHMRVCLRKRRQSRYVRFSPRIIPSSSVV